MTVAWPAAAALPIPVTQATTSALLNIPLTQRTQQDLKQLVGVKELDQEVTHPCYETQNLVLSIVT